VVAIAGGLGSFEPRKPLLENLTNYEDRGVEYMIKNPEKYRDKRMLLAGGGDSALDWTIYLAEIAKEVTLVHRRNEFRGALDSVEKVQDLKNQGKVRLITPAEIIAIGGQDRLEWADVRRSVSKDETEDIRLDIDHFIPLFGLSPKLGPIANWGLEIERNAIKVNNSLDYQTNIPGIYAIGDVNTYPGKLKLILCGFHEAALMCQSAYQRINPNKKYVLKYTTVGGIQGFDGTKKEAPKAVVKAID
jgi:thioredoxin reductase (NADPH)